MTSSMPAKSIPKGLEVQAIRNYFDRMRSLLPVPAAVGDNSNSPLTAPSPFHRISSAVDRQKSIIGQVSQTNSDSTERPCICNDVVLSILAEKEIEGGIVDGHVLQDYKNVNRNEKRSVQAADDKENGEIVPQEDENDRQENHRITDTTQRPSNLTQKAFSDLKFGCQRALACLLEKYMVESCLDFDEKQSLFHDLDKWLHITGFYDSKHRELVLRLCEAKEALEKQLNTLGHDDNIELEAATQNSPPKGLHPMVASTSDGCCSREQHNDKRSTEQVRKREASQDLLRESYKVSRGENHRDERPQYHSQDNRKLDSERGWPRKRSYSYTRCHNDSVYREMPRYNQWRTHPAPPHPSISGDISRQGQQK